MSTLLPPFSVRRRNRLARRRNVWRLAQLESRLMLAGDVGAVVADVAPAIDVAQTQSDRTLVVIDHRVSDLDLLQAGVSESAELIVVGENQNAIDEIGKLIHARNSSVASLHIVCHGSDGQLLLGDRTLDQEELQSQSAQLQSWSNNLSDNADIMLYGCNVTSSGHGIEFVERLAKLTGADVAASSNVTGANDRGVDWILEHTTGRIDVALAFDPAVRQTYQHTLNIVINAWGQTGDEQFELQIDGQTVQTYDAGTTWTPFVLQNERRDQRGPSSYPIHQ